MDDQGRSASAASLHWIKARASYGADACVELATADRMIALRDSKRPDVDPFRFTHREAEVFFAAVKQGEFDHLLDEIEAER